MQHTAACFLMLAALSPIAASAQTPPETLQKLEGLADQVKAALEQGDLDKANRLSSDLLTGIFRQKQALQPTPQQKLQQLEQTLPAAGPARSAGLVQVAKAAFEAGELDRADQYARELLLTATDKKDWNYGNAVFTGNLVIGRVALRRDKNVALAKTSLVTAGQTPGSPQLNSFGPNMSLAKDLLAAGERDAVLEFFASCRTFWKTGSEKLDAWTATVKGGGAPDFGANLVF